MFSDWVMDWANRPKIVKSYNTGPKGVLGPGDLKRCGSGQNFNMDQIGDFEIIEAQF